MTFPPLLLLLHLHHPQSPRLATLAASITLSLVWPLLLLLLVPLALAALLVASAVAPHQTTRLFALARTLFALVCGLRGLHVDVAGRHNQLLISFH